MEKKLIGVSSKQQKPYRLGLEVSIWGTYKKYLGCLLKMQIPAPHLWNITVYVEITNTTHRYLLVRSTLLSCGKKQTYLSLQHKLAF